LATDAVRYLSYLDALFIHFELMHLMGESRRGVFDRSLVESALARPRQAAAYENAASSGRPRPSATAWSKIIRGSAVTKGRRPPSSMSFSNATVSC
jgi:hypothetical protein